MTYRDDREAMHQRVQELERDLERAQGEAAGRKEAQQEVERLRSVLATAQRELERLRPKPAEPGQQQRRVAFVVAGAAVAMAVAGATFFLMVSRSGPGPVAPAASVPTTPAAPPPSPPSPLPLPPTRPEAAPEPKTGPPLERDAIRRVIQQHGKEVRRCYEQGLGTDPKLSGRVNVRFTIGATGTVVAASAQSSTLNNPTVESCITAAARRWVFPRPLGGGVVVVNFPFVLRSSEQ